MIGRLGVVLLATLLIPGVLVARAQTETPAPATQGTAVVEVRGWEYELDTGEPLIIYADQVTGNNEGEYIGALVFWRNPDGTFTRLTACDDVVVACAPLYTRATAALEGAQQGDAYALGDEVINRGD